MAEFYKLAGKLIRLSEVEAVTSIKFVPTATAQCNSLYFDIHFKSGMYITIKSEDAELLKEMKSNLEDSLVDNCPRNHLKSNCGNCDGLVCPRNKEEKCKLS